LPYSRVKRKSGKPSKGEKMDRDRRNPFHGLVDSISEWNRMREVGTGRIGPETGHEDRRRTHATAWVPATDVVARMWTSALAHCHGRFEGKGYLFSKEPSGGIGCFTPDSFPIFDTFRNNAYVIADSNHGYKMIGVGALVAKELLDGPQELLEPFRFSRYETGELHPTSHSPFPWS
jgi:hypothetical protein